MVKQAETETQSWSCNRSTEHGLLQNLCNTPLPYLLLHETRSLFPLRYQEPLPDPGNYDAGAWPEKECKDNARGRDRKP